MTMGNGVGEGQGEGGLQLGKVLLPSPRFSGAATVTQRPNTVTVQNPGALINHLVLAQKVPVSLGRKFSFISLQSVKAKGFFHRENWDASRKNVLIVVYLPSS